MTAPGNTALVVSLMAVFVACAAYAIGRSHQRNRDREDAYREGYENARRSTVSLAARAVARRRAARPSAEVSSAGLPSAGLPSADLPGAGGTGADGSSAGVSTTAGTGAGVSLSGASTEPEHPSAAPSRSAMPPPTAAAGHPVAVSHPAGSPPSEHNPTPLGFPVPPPAPPQLIGEPAAFGGVVYRPFPDPRLVGNSEPLPADRGSLHGVPFPRESTQRPPSPRPSFPHPAGPAAASAEGEPASTGRHTVPDELVRSTTYRLPADRVFRAKVPEPTDRPPLPDEPTTKLSVPKPRQS